MKNILLDLDNTIISSLAPEEEKRGDKNRSHLYRWEDMDGAFKVYERPGLQEFLDFLFTNFNVSVWTAASKSYALFIIDKFILEGHPARKLDYVFFSHHCRRSTKLKNSHKNLNMLWDEFGLDYDKDATYIIDDHNEVWETQPKKCIQISAFHFHNKDSHKDRELLSEIRPILEKILI